MHAEITRVFIGEIMKNQLICLCLLAPLHSAAATCDSAAHRAFDFWLGDWVVYKTDGTVAGHNQIRSAHQGCVITEQYTTPAGFSGQSLNLYDASRDVWHQTWTDSSGTLLILEGKAVDNGMLLSGKTQNQQGTILQHRIHWTANSDGSVRQHWQTKASEGEWTTAFDGLYQPETNPAESPAGND